MYTCSCLCLAHATSPCTRRPWKRFGMPIGMGVHPFAVSVFLLLGSSSCRSGELAASVIVHQQSQLRTPPRMLRVRNTRNWVRRLPESGGTGVSISFLSFLVTCHERSPLGYGPQFCSLGATVLQPWEPASSPAVFAPLALSSIVQDGSFSSFDEASLSSWVWLSSSGVLVDS